ncbi:EAL domain-containing protein [Neptuniibacter sp. QD57_21]|uniref:EAL domain-containing protein n=1 Tax=Neptuniibacter sp. QD57_21 TaxID=3398213 RepID=UPI0039F5F324
MKAQTLRIWNRQYLAPALISAIITLFITLFISYEQAEQHKQLQQRDLKTKARQLSEWLDINYSIINNVLIDLEKLSNQCSEEILFDMRSIMFNVAPVVEMGIIDADGQLICTSWKKHEKPIFVTPPPSQLGLRFLGPVNVEYMKQPAFVLARSLKQGGEVNALVRISWLKNQLQNRSSELGFTGLIHSDTGRPIIMNGPYARPQSGLKLPIDQPKVVEAEFNNGLEQVAAYSPLITFPELSVVISDEKQIIFGDQRNLSIQGIALCLSVWFLLTLLFQYLIVYLSDSAHLLKKAIKHGEFFNLYQPLIKASDKQIMGVEVLMRWQHPAEGLKNPVTFIPEAEEKGFINKMTSQQLKNCYDELRPILLSHPDFIVTINISSNHLLDAKSVRELIHYKTLIPNLVLEVTEDVLVDGADDRIQKAFIKLTAASIEIAIDDFGTGYCGLHYLGQLPVKYLKADKCFIASIGTDSINSHILEMIVSLAKKLDLITIAEGVETPHQVAHLDKLGIEIHQGWHYSRAIPAHELLQLIKISEQRSKRDIEIEEEATC